MNGIVKLSIFFKPNRAFIWSKNLEFCRDLSNDKNDLEPLFYHWMGR